MKQILCENPRIIFNPQLKNICLSCGAYFTPRGGVTVLTPEQKQEWFFNFPFKRFSQRRLEPNMTNLDDFFFINLSTGETFPIYIAVPCDKCLICRAKKASDWSFRCTAEMVTSKSPVYFVTLTYNTKHLPRFGVHKTAIQNFMKRLRINLDRLGVEHNIRYFAVSEYGSRKHRPHYHLILYNFPQTPKLATLPRILHFIENAWSTLSYDDDGNPIVKRTYVNGKLRLKFRREPLGFAYCVPCDKGALSYVVKYMRKPPLVPAGKNETFYLCSKGIGSDYADRFMNHYRSHPEHLEISLVDPISNKEITQTLPKYFVNRYFPSISKLIPKETRECYETFVSLLATRNYITTYYDNVCPSLSYPSCSSEESTIISLFGLLIHGNEIPPILCSRDKSFIYAYRYRRFPSSLQLEYHQLNYEIDNCIEHLKHAYNTLDIELIKSIPAWKLARSLSLDSFFGARLPVSIPALVDSIKRKNLKIQYAESPDL